MIRVRAIATTCITLALATLACQGGGPVGPRPTQRPAATNAPAVGATTAAAATASLLQRPPGDVTRMAGKVSIDVGYAVPTHGGTLVSNHGGGVLAAGDATLAAGAGLVAKVKGAVGIIGDDGSGLVSEHGGGVVALSAGNVIANNSGGLISEHGGGLLADHGSGLLLDQGAGYHVLADGPAFGDEAPAAGLQLQAVDMTSGRALPLGVSPDGKPVYAVYTNLAGGYEIYLPGGSSDNVRLVASVPAKEDPRLRPSLIVAAKDDAAQQLDEDAAAMTRYLRLVFRAKFQSILRLQDQGTGKAQSDDELVHSFLSGNPNNPAVVAFMGQLLHELLDELHRNPRIRPADFADVAVALGDAMLARAGDLSPYTIDQSLYGADRAAAVANNPLHEGHALGNMAKILGLLRRQVVTDVKGKSAREAVAFFAARPWLQRANDYHARLAPSDPRPYYVIEKASDLADFLVLDYFSLVAPAAYGCLPGVDCPASSDHAGCDLASGCFPAGGIGAVSTTDISDLSRAVLRDMGLDDNNVFILDVGAESLGTALVVHLLDPSFKAGLLCIIRNWGLPNPAPCDAAASGTP